MVDLVLVPVSRWKQSCAHAFWEGTMHALDAAVMEHLSRCCLRHPSHTSAGAAYQPLQQADGTCRAASRPW